MLEEEAPCDRLQFLYKDTLSSAFYPEDFAGYLVPK